MLALACHERGRETDAEVAPEADLPRTDGLSNETPAARTENVADVFWNPLMALADVPGPTPLFDTPNDEAGNRYVVGEGEAQPTEGGETIMLSNVMTMVPGSPDDAELEDPDGDDLVTLPIHSKITADLQKEIEALALTHPDSTIDVIISISHQEEGLQVSLDRAMAKGMISTRLQYQQQRQNFINDRRTRILADEDAVSAQIESVGGTILARGENIPYLVARLPSDSVENVAGQPAVVRLDTTNKTAVPLADADGLAHQHGAQIRQYITSGYTGEGDSFFSHDDLVVAIVEPDSEGGQAASFLTSHSAWREASSTSAFRFAPTETGRWDCVGLLDCIDVQSYLEPPSSHATNIAGIIFGDFTEGQHPGVPTGDRERSSGFAREARAHFYLFDSANAVIKAMDHIVGLAYEANVINNSYKYDFNPACAGDSLVSQAANQVFLSGSAFFAGAGNNPGSSSSCQVRAPGDAIGSFTVGAHMQSGGTNLDVRGAAIFDDGLEGSAWGGNSTQGQNRSIVSITAAGRRTYRVSENGSYTTSAAVGKTSFGTAVVSATALDLMDYHTATGSSWIDAPSALYAALLVMGDRYGVNGKHASVPDHRWGVGRLRARMFGNGGTDAPYWWYHGYSCIGDGEVWKFNLSGAIMPADVDSVKAAAYWYDYRHDGSDGNAPAGEVANVNISLWTSTSLMAFDSDAYDNKAFVYRADWPEEPVFLQFFGADVEGHHDPACSGTSPNDQIKVYFHIFAEDDDRESPTYDPMTGEGIYPESL